MALTIKEIHVNTTSAVSFYINKNIDYLMRMIRLEQHDTDGSSSESRRRHENTQEKNSTAAAVSRM